MISIIIPVYNQGKKLIKTLESIGRQSYTDYEVIIVNDGSTDDVESLFAGYCQKQSNNNHYLFINQINRGAPAARNRGYQEARGEYLFFCDADAILKPEALEIMLKTLNDNPTAAYAYSSFYWGKKLFTIGEFDPDKLRKMPCIHTMSLLRRSAYPNGGWDESIKKLQDWDLWLTILEKGGCGIWIPRALFTVSPGGVISSWLPSFAYKYLPFLKTVKKYQSALKIVKDKHGLN